MKSTGRSCSRSTTRNVLSMSLAASIVASVALAGVGIAKDGEPEHALFRALRRGDVALVRDLLRERTPPDIRDAAGTTPLMLAARRGDVECVGLLLEHGADPNASNERGVTALIWGAGEPEVVRMLLERGADPNARSAIGNTPLLVAAAHAQTERSVELLLERGAAIDARNSRGRSAASNAVYSGSPASLGLLLARGGRGLPLADAAERGDVEIVRMLLEHGAGRDASGKLAGQALNRALLAQRPDVAKLLIDAGIALDEQVPAGNVPTVVLTAYSEVGDCSIARLFVERGVDLDARSRSEETALTWARKRGHREMIELFEKAGAKDPSPPKSKRAPSRDVRLEGEGGQRLVATAVERSLALLQHSSDVFLKSREDCVSCHHQNLPAMALGWARDRGFVVNDDAMRRMAEQQVRSWAPRVERAYEMDRPVPVPPRFLGYGFLGFAALGYPADELTEAMAWYLARLQRADGHWFPGVRRPPLGGGEILATAIAMRSLQLYPLEGRGDEMAGRVRRARQWLLAATPQTHQEEVFRMLGLAWSGSGARELDGEASRLLAAQRDDGGWAQLPGLESDAWATGQSLVALATAGGMPVSHDVYRRGMEFLLRTQFDDGSWYVRTRTWPFQPHFDSEFPHGKDQWVSAPATAWAAMALTLAVPRFTSDAGDAVAGTRGEASEKPSAAAESTDDAGAPVDFARDIRPLLERSCLACHGHEDPKSGLRVTTLAALEAGGESGQPALVRGKSAESLLFKVVSGRVEDMEMPPLRRREEFPALDALELDIVRRWIDQGAPWPEELELGAARARHARRRSF